MSNPGICEGEVCGRLICQGVIKCHPVENCSCHISPPCGACTAPRNFCPACGWEESDDEIVNDYVVNVDRQTGNYRTWAPRPLDPTKIDWHSKSHTHFSMIMEGVYPVGTEIEDVLKLVRGTFGGRFEYFRDGKFRYIAYTD